MDCSVGEISSKLTLRSSFFDNLWPLILDDNVCDIHSKQNTWYFEPIRNFRQLHWHRFLADVGFPNYAQPTDLRCCSAAEKELAENEAAEHAADVAAEELAVKIPDPDTGGSRAILSLDKRLKAYEERQKLAYDFINRKYPWQMQQPSFEKEFEITPELLRIFKVPFERKILRAINAYEIRLMIIDAGTEICFEDFQRWFKFRTFVQLLAVVRCPRVQRQLLLMEGVFKTILIEENMENSWHEELLSSLRIALKYAKDNEMHKNCGDAIVYVFSDQRGICTCNTFKVLRIK